MNIMNHEKAKYAILRYLAIKIVYFLFSVYRIQNSVAHSCGLLQSLTNSAYVEQETRKKLHSLKQYYTTKFQINRQ